MQYVKVSELIPHSRNNEFFDDMSGGKWNDFLESVRTSGVIEPIVITEDRVIVSGHQRVRACKELGIDEILADVRIYNHDENKIVKDLIETNVRQRGNIGGSDEQITARVEALKVVYGVRNGRPKKNTENFSSFENSLEEVCKLAGTTKENYWWAKQSEKVIPEIKDLVKDGQISTTTMTQIISKLSPEQQHELAQMLPQEGKVTAKETKEYIELLRAKEEVDKKLEVMTKEAADALTSIKLGDNSDAFLDMKQKADEAEQKYRDEYERRQADTQRAIELRKKLLGDNDKLNIRIHELEAKLKIMEDAAKDATLKPEIVEVVPQDYEAIKKELKELKEFKESAYNTNSNDDVTCSVDNIRNGIMGAHTAIEIEMDKINDKSIAGMFSNTLVSRIDELIGMLEKLKEMNMEVA